MLIPLGKEDPFSSFFSTRHCWTVSRKKSQYINLGLERKSDMEDPSLPLSSRTAFVAEIPELQMLLHGKHHHLYITKLLIMLLSFGRNTYIQTWSIVY